MIKRTYLHRLFVTVLLSLFGCSEQRASTNGQPHTEGKQTHPIEATVGVAPAMLSDARLAELSKAGLEGDESSAFRVLVYYEMAMLDRRNSEYWAQIAAENGHVEGIVRHGGYLLDLPGFESCHRARFWLGRARQLATAEYGDTVSAFEQEVTDRCSKVFESGGADKR